MYDLRDRSHCGATITIQGKNDDPRHIYEELSVVVSDLGNKDNVIVGEYSLMMNLNMDY